RHARLRADAAVDDSVALDGVVVERRRGGTVDVDPEAELIEEQVIDEALGAGGVLRIDAMRRMIDALTVEAVVIDDVAVRLDVRARGPQSHPVARMIVNHQIDVLTARTECADARHALFVWITIGDLEVPIPCVRTVDR